MSAFGFRGIARVNQRGLRARICAVYTTMTRAALGARLARGEPRVDPTTLGMEKVIQIVK